MDELRWEFEVHHFYWEVLSLWVVDCDASINTACDQQVSLGLIPHNLHRLVELRKLFSHASSFDVKHPHRATLKTAREQRQSRMR